MSNKYRFVITAVIATLIAVINPAGAAHANNDKEHCLLEVIGEDLNRHFITGPLTCYETLSEVDQAARAESASGFSNNSLTPLGVTSSLGTTSSLLLSGIIAIHFDGLGGFGASLSILGDICNGGGLNLPLNWNDRISSTLSTCPVNLHYEHSNYTGSTATTSIGLYNISGYMNNKTSSITYS